MYCCIYSRTPPNEHSGQANTPLEWTIQAGPNHFPCIILLKTLPDERSPRFPGLTDTWNGPKSVRSRGFDEQLEPTTINIKGSPAVYIQRRSRETDERMRRVLFLPLARLYSASWLAFSLRCYIYTKTLMIHVDCAVHIPLPDRPRYWPRWWPVSLMSAALPNLIEIHEY